MDNTEAGWRARVLAAAARRFPPPEGVDFPRGRMRELPGRGSTYVVDVPGPRGAPTLVLLHALACTGALSWFPSVAALSKHHRLVLFDQRWHGRGIRSPRFRLTDCADDVAAVADLLGLERFVPVGYSMGGAVAQLTWRRHRERVAGLVLAGTSRNFRGTPKERVAFGLLGAGTSSLGELCRRRAGQLAARLPAEPAALAATDPVSPWALAEFRSTSLWSLPPVLREIGRFDSSPWVGRIDVPTSVVVVSGDRLVPARRQRRLAAAIPGATAYEVSGGHAALVLGSDGFVPVLAEACREVTRRVEVHRSA